MESHQSPATPPPAASCPSHLGSQGEGRRPHAVIAAPVNPPATGQNADRTRGFPADRLRDSAKAREWLEFWTDVSGVEGIAVKGMSTRYLTGYRGWLVNCTDLVGEPDAGC